MYRVYSDPCGVAHCWMAGLVIKPTHVLKSTSTEYRQVGPYCKISTRVLKYRLLWPQGCRLRWININPTLF